MLLERYGSRIENSIKLEMALLHSATVVVHVASGGGTNDSVVFNVSKPDGSNFMVYLYVSSDKKNRVFHVERVKAVTACYFHPDMTNTSLPPIHKLLIALIVTLVRYSD